MTIDDYSSLFVTFRDCSPLFTLSETIRTIRDYSHYSLFAIRVFQTPTTICYYSPLFETVRHCSHYSYYSLFAIWDYSLFAIRVFQAPDKDKVRRNQTLGNNNKDAMFDRKSGFRQGED